MTYDATVKGDHINWDNGSPHELSDGRTIRIRAIVIEAEPTNSPQTRGQRMAAALRELAKSDPFAGIDPVEWQREIRKDRPLPGREE